MNDNNDYGYDYSTNWIPFFCNSDYITYVDSHANNNDSTDLEQQHDDNIHHLVSIHIIQTRIVPET